MEPEGSRSKEEGNPPNELWEIPAGQLCSCSREPQSKLEQENDQVRDKREIINVRVHINYAKRYDFNIKHSSDVQ